MNVAAKFDRSSKHLFSQQYQKTTSTPWVSTVLAQVKMYMRKLIQITIFFGWIAAMVWTGLELEKIDFFGSLIAKLML